MFIRFPIGIGHGDLIEIGEHGLNHARLLCGCHQRRSLVSGIAFRQGQMGQGAGQTRTRVDKSREKELRSVLIKRVRIFTHRVQDVRRVALEKNSES